MIVDGYTKISKKQGLNYILKNALKIFSGINSKLLKIHLFMDLRCNSVQRNIS